MLPERIQIFNTLDWFSTTIMSVTGKKPLIGINLDYSPEGASQNVPILEKKNISKEELSPYSHHLINTCYTLAVERAGGIPFPIPHAFSSICDYVNMVDGFVFSGGLIDIDPQLYGEKATTDTLYIETQRSRFDLELMRLALESGKPILGICAGCQLLNVVRGGTLHQHIPNEFEESDIEHFEYYNRYNTIHKVYFESGSKLGDVMSQKMLGVNSMHHMAVKDAGRNLRVSARSEDGVPEAIECTQSDFVIGVQWHPEYFPDTCHEKLFGRLIEVALTPKNIVEIEE